MSEKETWRLIIYEFEEDTGYKTVKDILEKDFHRMNERTGLPFVKSMRRRAFEWIAEYLDDAMIVEPRFWEISRPDLEIR